ncbi:MAG: ABC transporter permease [Dehalococcoidales bacterium]|nr:ABC transporter permease [Dehalococcoidales bacterium]
MRSYLIRRLLLIIPTLLIVSLLVFFISRSIPGSVIDMMMSQQEFATENTREEIVHRLGMDVPMYVQYFRWMGTVLQGDLGQSLWSNRRVVDELALRWPVTLELAVMALVTSQLIALPIGIYSAIRQDTIGDYFSRSFAIACIATPSFWLGTLVMVFPSVWWGWSPPMSYIPFARDPAGNIVQFIIPAFILGMVLSGSTMRMTRNMMLEVLRQDYIRTAWSKGLRERSVVARHALKNALMPVITVVGLQIPIVMGGSIVLERIFVLPGIGSLLIEVLVQRDYSMLSGINLAMASVVLIINLLVDLTYGYLDPRVHYK